MKSGSWEPINDINHGLAGKCLKIEWSIGLVHESFGRFNNIPKSSFC